MNVIPFRVILKSKILTQGAARAQRRILIPLHREVYYSSLTSVLTVRFDIVVTMLAAGNINCNEDTVDCPRFVAFAMCLHLKRRQLLKLQSRTVDEEKSTVKAKNLTTKEHCNHGGKSTTTGTILFGVANRLHIHL